MSTSPAATEWLETDGLGGFASGTISGVRTRRYHALLLAATKPPAGRMVLVSGFDAWVDTAAGTFAISAQRYAPEVIHPDGDSRLVRFCAEPWPCWTWLLGDGLRLVQEIFVVHGQPAVAVGWRIEGPGAAVARLRLRPFLAGRDFHSLGHENGGFSPSAKESLEVVEWTLGAKAPAVSAHHNGSYRGEPCWYRNFLYTEEQARGFDETEDLISPGFFEWDLLSAPAVLILATPAAHLPHAASAAALFSSLRQTEALRRAQFASPLHRAADAYFVRRGAGRTIIAGYPWFGDWGRDTFIALRGMCLSLGRMEDARDILLEWSGTVSEGMLPNRFPDSGDAPEYNSVDASLWYIVAVHDYLAVARMQRKAGFFADGHRQRLKQAIDAILAGYAAGTRFGIRAEADGLLACGQAGVQLTWMDAKAGDWVVTPRIGKPVEVQALWLNALRIGAEWSTKWDGLYARGVAAFHERFWNEETGGLFDILDCDHEPGRNDASVRPNQIFAVGGLPFALLNGYKARRVVETVEAKLLTPLGLRSLARDEPAYQPRYEGDVRQRDGAYHQGTVWPWLMGPFVEAWLRSRGATSKNKAAARERFLAPLREHLAVGGIGHISEIADAEPPYTPRGCPFQAWSLAEFLRLEQSLLR